MEGISRKPSGYELLKPRNILLEEAVPGDTGVCSHATFDRRKNENGCTMQQE
jgi:hypothetical protein